MDLATDGSLPELVEKYVRTWDARSDGSLVDEVMAPDVVDHQPVGTADGVAERWGQFNGLDMMQQLTTPST